MVDTLLSSDVCDPTLESMAEHEVSAANPFGNGSYVAYSISSVFKVVAKLMLLIRESRSLTVRAVLDICV